MTIIGRISIFDYNDEKMKNADDYFDYRSKRNGSNEITGIMWMTGQIMRADFDKYTSLTRIYRSYRLRSINFMAYMYHMSLHIGS